jgi:Trypsin-like peptidase domain
MDENSLVLISSIDQDNKNFGTGFIIDQHDGNSYILTCAHVVRGTWDKDEKVKVNNFIAEVEAISPPNGIDDLAVLRVEGQIGTPLLKLDRGEEGLDFTSLGYQTVTARGMTESAITKPLQGTLGASITQRVRGQSFHTRLWELNIKDSSLPQRGYSGAPIVVDTGQKECIIGVLSMQQRERIFAISIEALDRVWPEQAHVQFTNREDELTLILSSSAPAYYLLDGPAGYGKSTLLRQLEKEFSSRKWRCAYLVLNSALDLEDLAEAIAEKFSISGMLSNSRTDESAGLHLGSALRRNWDNSQEGIVLLFDLDKGFSHSDLLEKLLKEFIPEIEESLKNIPPFVSGDNRFRVVIAGRYLFSFYNQLSVQILPLVPSLRYLTPFKYDVIQNSTRLYLKSYPFPLANQIAGHILYLTGGHPGCMAKVLQLFEERGGSPETIMGRQKDRIWNEIVGPVVSNIEAGFPTPFGVHKLMKNNVLRYMDYAALREVVNLLEISEVQQANDFDEIDLSDTLTGAALLNWNEYLLHDDITRRLISIGLRTRKGDEFVELCRKAQKICEERLLDETTPNPDKWAIEYLFQYLQQHASLISRLEHRRELHDNLLSQELPKVLQWLATGRRAREQQGHLLRSIDRDWEFMFTTNYYLRGTEYNDRPIRELKTEVNRILGKQ